MKDQETVQRLFFRVGSRRTDRLVRRTNAEKTEVVRLVAHRRAKADGVNEREWALGISDSSRKFPLRNFNSGSFWFPLVPFGSFWTLHFRFQKVVIPIFIPILDRFDE